MLCVSKRAGGSDVLVLGSESLRTCSSIVQEVTMDLQARKTPALPFNFLMSLGSFSSTSVVGWRFFLSSLTQIPPLRELPSQADIPRESYSGVL